MRMLGETLLVLKACKSTSKVKSKIKKPRIDLESGLKGELMALSRDGPMPGWATIQLSQNCHE